MRETKLKDNASLSHADLRIAVANNPNYVQYLEHLFPEIFEKASLEVGDWIYFSSTAQTMRLADTDQVKRLAERGAAAYGHASASQIRHYLTSCAVEMGYKKGLGIDYPWSTGAPERKIEYPEFNGETLYHKNGDYFEFQGVVVYRKGVWASIVPEITAETTTVTIKGVEYKLVRK